MKCQVLKKETLARQYTYLGTPYCFWVILALVVSSYEGFTFSCFVLLILSLSFCFLLFFSALSALFSLYYSLSFPFHSWLQAFKSGLLPASIHFETLALSFHSFRNLEQACPYRSTELLEIHLLLFFFFFLVLSSSLCFLSIAFFNIKSQAGPDLITLFFRF